MFLSQMGAERTEMWHAIVNGEPVNMVDFLGLHCDDDLAVENGIGSFAELERACMEKEAGTMGTNTDAAEDKEAGTMGTNTDAAEDKEAETMEPETRAVQKEDGVKEAADGEDVKETKQEKKKRKMKERKLRLKQTRAEEKRQVATGELSLEEFNRREIERFLEGTAMREKGELKKKSKEKIERKMAMKENKLRSKLKI